MATVQAICEQLQVYMLTLPNISSAPPQPTDHLSPGVVSLCYPVSGDWISEAASVKRGLHVVAINIYTPLKDTARDFLILMPYVEAVPNLLYSKLSADNWGGTIDAFMTLSYSFAITTYAGIPMRYIQYTVGGIKTRSDFQ